MTISSVENRKETAGNGVTVSFATPPFLQDSDIKVKLVVDATGVATDWVLSTQYTLSGAGDAGGGTLTVDTSPTDYTPQTGETLVIYTDPTLTQATDLVDNDALPAETVEDVFDKLTLIAQRLSDRADRALRQTDSDVGDIGELPVKADRASQLLGFDVNGDPIASAGTGGVATSTFMATVLDDATKEDAIATLGAANVVTSITTLKAETLLTNGRTVYLSQDGRYGFFKFSTANLSASVSADTQNGIYVPPNSDATGASGAWVRQTSSDVVNVKWYGATGDGTTDDLTAVQVCANNNIGRQIYFPKGSYKLSGPLTFAAGSTGIYLRGDGVEVTNIVFSATSGDGISLAGEADNLTIRDLHIKAATTSSGDAIAAKGTTAASPLRDLIMENVNVSGFLRGVVVYGGLGCRILHGRISGQGNGVANGRGVLWGKDATDGVNHAHMLATYVSAYQVSIDAAHVGALQMDSCILGGATALKVQQYSIVYANNLYFDSGTTVDIDNAGYLIWSGLFSSLAAKVVNTTNKRIKCVGHELAAVKAYINTPQNVPTGVYTKIQFDAEAYDNEGHYDNVTNHRFVAPFPGFYQVTVAAKIRMGVISKTYQIAIYKQGAIEYEEQYSGNDTAVPHDTSMSVTGTVWLNQGERVEGYFQHDEGVAVTLRSGVQSSYMSVIAL